MTDYDDLCKRLRDPNARYADLGALAFPAADAIAALLAERDALRKDALRYRWLRDNCQYQEGISPVLRSDSANELDAAIDADLAGAKA